MREPPTTERLRGVRVLVLDDDASARERVGGILSQAGCAVEGVAGKREGFQMLARRDFDVVVAGYGKRDAGAEVFLQEARSFWPWLGVVLLTDREMARVKADAQHLGIESVLAKPADAAELAAAVAAEAARKEQHLHLSSERSPRLQNRLDHLRRLSEAAVSTENLIEALRRFTLGVGQLVPCSAVGVLNLEKDESSLTLHAIEPVRREFLSELADRMFTRYEILTGRTLHRDAVTVRQEGLAAADSGVRTIGNLFSVPIITGHEIHGLLSLAAASPEAFGTEELAFLYYATSYLSTVLIALSRMRRVAVRDVLTNLFNRRGIREELERAWQFALRYRHALGVVILDIDHFKMLNESYGHPVGDQVLCEFGQLLQRVARAADVVGRFGGDEMVVILPLATETNVEVFGKRLLNEIRSHVFCEKTLSLHLTASIGGTSCLPAEGGYRPEDLLQKADQALCVAKRNGRDRIIMWEEYAPPGGGVAAAAPEPPLPAAAVAGRILIVDDDTVITMMVKEMLRGESYEVEAEATGEGALGRLGRQRELFDLVLVDLGLPGVNGLELMDRLRKMDESIVRIVITGAATTDNVIASLQRGAYDFIGKPFKRMDLLATVRRAMEYRRLLLENRNYQLNLERIVRARSAALVEALAQVKEGHRFTLEALAGLADAHEHSTGQHSVRVAKMAKVLAVALRVPEKGMEEIEHGALLHDIGKIAVPDAVLLKPGPLTDEEWAVMRTHPEVGFRLLSQSPYLAPAARIVYEHQERCDGSGYPRGLKGDEICLGARLFAVVDTYDAMRSARVYSKPRPKDDAVREIKELSGTKFDPAIVDVFLRCLPELEKIGSWDS